MTIDLPNDVDGIADDAGREALRIASTEDDMYAARTSMGQSLEQIDVVAQHREPTTIHRQLGRQRQLGIPVDCSHRAAECSPAIGIFGQHHRAVVATDESGAEYGANAGLLEGLLELDRAVDAVDVGQCECPIAALHGSRHQRLR